MNDFTASNGVRIETAGSDMTYSLWNIGGNEGVHFTGDEWAALGEVFQAERDAELGRWRWPKNPDYVVYDGDPYRVLNECSGESTKRNGLYAHDMEGEAASDRHLSSEGSPWRRATPGEAWFLTVDGIGMALTVDSHGEFQGLVTRSPQSGSITAGRRIWPEVSA